MNDRGHYGSHDSERAFVVGAGTTTSETPSTGFSWGGLVFFGLVGAGLVVLVRPHYREVKELERRTRERSGIEGSRYR